jgi:hypothetical protein
LIACRGSLPGGVRSNQSRSRDENIHRRAS